MRFGHAIRRQREIHGLALEDVAAHLGLEISAYRTIEEGGDVQLEEAAGQVLGFAELIGGRANQLYYPCGIPFQKVTDFDVSS